MIKLKRLPASETIDQQNTTSPACSIRQRPWINTIAARDQFQRIQISAELRRWQPRSQGPLSTSRKYVEDPPSVRLGFLEVERGPWERDWGGDYSSLFATIRRYSPLFATIRHCSPLFAVRYSLFATIRYSLFAIRCSLFAVRYSWLFAIRVFQTPTKLWHPGMGLV